jgi:hypothetical protein
VCGVKNKKQTKKTKVPKKQNFLVHGLQWLLLTHPLLLTQSLLLVAVAWSQSAVRSPQVVVKYDRGVTCLSPLCLLT